MKRYHNEKIIIKEKSIIIKIPTQPISIEFLKNHKLISHDNHSIKQTNEHLIDKTNGFLLYTD